VILDNPPNQFARRGSLPSGKHLKLTEDILGEFDRDLHDDTALSYGKVATHARKTDAITRLDSDGNFEISE
jgi:hypothetical protein